MNSETVHQRRWAILGVMSLSLVIVMLNNVTLNVALPELSKDLQADNTELQWIMDAYALIFGGTLLVMGAIGDRFGRKGALQFGLIMVAGASALTALYADSSNDVIAARAVMGLGAALVMPATLSVVVVVFPPEERGKAVGIWAAMAGVGAPIGLIVGGWAVENYDWQMVFWINVPIIIIALLLGLILVPKTKDEKERPLDPIGALISVAALGSILYAIIEGPSVGWTSSEILGIGALGVILSASFGIIVVVFQDGLLTGVLNYSAQPLDLTVPPLVFGIAFGLSMDYEVLMLSRIHEAWEETGDNTRAVAEGLQASGSLITGAAAIMVAVFFGFILADVLIIKSIGFALAVAVIVDATIVRAIVVPATMRLLGKANWWSPKWLE